MSKLDWFSRACALSLLWTAPAAADPAHFKSLSSFTGANGAYPWATLMQASNGDFYGTTQNGGTSSTCTLAIGCGTVFRVTHSGKLTIFNFGGSNGSQPFSGLVQGANGNLYGTTLTGGPANQICTLGCGTVFEITPQGVMTTLHNFSWPDGADPEAALLLATDGNFYGTTATGGDTGGGTLFKITPTGTLTSLWEFDFSPYGIAPTATLVQGPEGDFYGTTSSGGADGGAGTVFRFTSGGKYIVLHSFEETGTDGYAPYGALILGSDGNFYGTTESGGEFLYYGTIFKITPRGKLTTMHSFDMTDGDVPTDTLIEGTNGKFYGTAAYGGTGNFGTVFEMNAVGKLTTLHSFDSTDGAYPYAGLLRGKDGKLYGSTFAGGPASTVCQFGCGTVFSVSVGH